MKLLFTFHLILVSLFLSAQEPLIYFDKTRCQKQAEMYLKFDGGVLYSLDMGKLVSVNFPISAIALWEKVDGHFEKRELVFNTNKRIFFARTGFYILTIFDAVQAQLIELNIGEDKIKITLFAQCALHY